MDYMERNAIFMENERMIRRVMRRNWLLICAMRLDQDDVYQELAIAALNAIDAFDPARAACIQAHIWMKLQYTILSIKRQWRPCGLTGLGGRRPVVVSLDQFEGMDRFLAAASHTEPVELPPALRRALSRLNEEEREAVARYLSGQNTKRDRTVKSALEKVRCDYLSAVTERPDTIGVW